MLLTVPSVNFRAYSYCRLTLVFSELDNGLQLLCQNAVVVTACICQQCHCILTEYNSVFAAGKFQIQIQRV